MKGANMIYHSSVGFIKVRQSGPNPPDGSDVWWRADDRIYANFDPFAEDDQPQGTHVVIEFTPFIVEKYTPKGVWLRSFLGNRFFQIGNAIRQTAVPTKELALQDLVKRKEKHVKMSEKRLAMAKRSLDMATYLLSKGVQ